jgi:endonuclease IV
MNLVKKRTKKDLEGLQYELDIMEELDGYVVIHPNSPAVEGGPTNKQGRDTPSANARYKTQYTKAIDTMISNIKLLDNQHRLLLEPPAGEGQKIGWSFEQLEYMCTKLDEEDLPVGFCIDTCHSFGAGLSRFKSASSTMTFIENLDTVGVLHRLKSIHLNDSKQPYGSLKDSHELLGKGLIWSIKKKGLVALVKYCYANNIDIICETGGQHDVDVAMNCLDTN